MEDGFYALDAEWRFTYLNRSVETATGLSRGEMVGRTIWECCPEAEASPLGGLLRAAKAEATRKVAVVFEPLVRGWYRVTAQPQGDGLMVQLSGAPEPKGEDLRFRVLFEEAPDAHLVFSERGILYGNRAAERLLRLPGVRLLGRHARDLAAPGPANDPSDAWGPDILERAFLEGRATFEWMISSEDGAVRPLEVAIAPMPSEGPTAFLATLRDPREWRRSQMVDPGEREEAVCESEATYRMLVDHSRAVMFSLSLSGDLLYVSRAWQDVIGTPAEEARGLSFTDFVHPDDVQTCRAYVHRVRSDASYLGAAEFRVRASDGSYRWFSGRAAAVRDAEGRPLHLVGVAVDVTDRVHAEAAHSESLRRLRAVFNQQFQFMAILAPDGTILEVNDLVQDACGVAVEAVQGVPFWAAPWWRDPQGAEEIWRSRIGQATSGGGTVLAEDWYQGYGGDCRLAATSTTAVYGEAGVELVVVQGSDITDRRRAESALHEQMRLTHTIADHAESALAMVDERGRFEFVNQAFCRITGYDPVEVLGESVHEVLHYKRPDGTPFPACECPIFERFSSGQPLRDFEDTYIRHDGSLMPVSVSLVPIPKEGSGAGSVLEFRDVSESRARERALQLMLGLGEAMRDLHDPESIMAVAAQMLGEHLRASQCLFVDIDSERAWCTVAHAWLPAAAPLKEGYPLATGMGSDPIVTTVGDATIRCPIVVRGCPIAKLVVRCEGSRTWTPDEVELVQTVAHRCWAEIERARAETERRQAYEATLEGWIRTLDARDHETEGHSRRVADMAVRLARRLGYPEAEMVNLYRGALLHDIGKMGVPDCVLQKPGPLTEAEREVMKRHPDIAMEMLSPIRFLKPALDIPYAHHERWDGGGYPRGLRETEIPWSARIFAIVDVYDALTSDRPYRAAWTRERTLAHLAEGAGSHFDPAVVAAFLEMVGEERCEVDAG